MTKSLNFYNAAMILNIFFFCISFLTEEQRQKYYICDPSCNMSTHALISIFFMASVTVKYKDYIYVFKPTEL